MKMTIEIEQDHLEHLVIRRELPGGMAIYTYIDSLYTQNGELWCNIYKGIQYPTGYKMFNRCESLASSITEGIALRIADGNGVSIKRMELKFIDEPSLWNRYNGVDPSKRYILDPEGKYNI